MENNLLQAGAAVADITPPLEVGLLTSSVAGTYAPFTAVRLPLKARVVVLVSGAEKVALVSLDLLALNDTSVDGWDDFKAALSDEIAPANIILTCTHTHTAPESVALSELYLTAEYRRWLHEIKARIKNAIRQALQAATACSVSIGSTRLEGYSLQRRVPTAAGITMSDALQPVSAEMMAREPIDRRVHAIRFHSNSGDAIATIVHAVCHPVHEMCLPHVSPDFPGELCMALEGSGGSGVALFLNGAAGDINPPTVSGGAEAARRHGQALANVVQQAGWITPEVGTLAFQHLEMDVPVRSTVHVSNPLDALARLNGIAIGPLAIVFLPGEPFTDTALEIEYRSPFAYTLVAAYAENSIGYVPTMEAFEAGGYETGPGKWSFLAPVTAQLMEEAALHLLDQLNNKIRKRL
jgi:neutral ceramidase